MSDLNMSIGSTIKERRESLSIKQDDLAERVGVTVQTMSKWERDLTEPKASQVSRLSKALRISEKEICKGESAQKTTMDPFSFVRKVSALMNEIPHTELLIGMQDFIEDEEGFFRMLASISNYPYDVFEDEKKYKNKMMVEMALNGQIKFNSEEEEKDFMETFGIHKSEFRQ